MGSICKPKAQKNKTVKETVSDKTFQKYIEDAKAGKQFDVKTLDPYNNKDDIRNKAKGEMSKSQIDEIKGLKNIFGTTNITDKEGGYQKFMANRDASMGTKLGNALQGIAGLGPMGRMLGMNNSPLGRKDRMYDVFTYAGQNPNAVTLGDDGLSMAIDTGKGTINIGKSGFATYSGPADADYDGPFANLVNPKAKKDDDDPIEVMDTRTPLDPCPEGFKYNASTEQCEPVDEEDGTGFVKTESIATAIPDLERYGRDGGEYLFFSEMPGVPDPMEDGGLPRQPSGEVKGPGGPKDDLVGPILLSSREYVLPYEQVLEQGNGNYDVGIKTLEKERKAALKKYANRTKSA